MVYNEGHEQTDASAKTEPHQSRTRDERRVSMLKIGQKAPDFTLPSHLDRDVTLSDLEGTNVVIAFFPLAWTPV
jgi:peroxiredoxin